jgi:hypothetical protein
LKYPKDLETSYKTGKLSLHKWYKDPLNAASRRYESSNKADLHLDIPICESWLYEFCQNIESETYSSAIVDKLYSDIDKNFFHLQDIYNVATGKSLFDRNFMQYTKHELYYDCEYQNLQHQDPFIAIGSYFKDSRIEYLTLPLLLLE